MVVTSANANTFRTEVTIFGVPKILTIRGTGFVSEVIDGKPVLVSGSVSRITFTATFSTDPGYIDAETTSYTLIDLPVSAVEELTALVPTWTDPESFNELHLSLSGETMVVNGPPRFDNVWGEVVLQDGDGVGYDLDHKIITDAGDNNINVYSGNTEIYAGAGNDWIQARNGTNTLFGQDGDDDILAAGSGEIHGGRGNDTLRAYNLEGETITVYGGSGDDEIFSAYGDNILLGGAGNDIIASASGANTIKGHSGDDLLIGGTGNDAIHGGADNDIMIDEAGNDFMFGGSGNDTILSVEGDDKIRGGLGDDFLIAAGGNDRVAGDAGADTFAFVDAVITTTETDPYAYFDGPITGTANVVDFDVAEDMIAVQYLESTTAEEQFDLFLAQAQQAGDNVVWTSSDDGFQATIRNLDLDDLTDGNFVAVESELALIL